MTLTFSIHVEEEIHWQSWLRVLDISCSILWKKFLLMMPVSSLGFCCREVLFGHFVRSVWSVVKNSSMAGNLSELLEEIQRERERERERERKGVRKREKVVVRVACSICCTWGLVGQAGSCWKWSKGRKLYWSGDEMNGRAGKIRLLW